MNPISNSSAMAGKPAVLSTHSVHASPGMSTEPQTLYGPGQTGIEASFATNKSRNLPDATSQRGPWASRFYLLVICIVLLTMAIAPAVSAAVRYSVATGNWNATSTWSATNGGASGATVPVAGDDVFIVDGFNVTVTAAASCATITFTTATATSLTINTGVTLTVSGLVSIPRIGTGSNVLAVGDGIMTAGSVSLSSGNNGLTGHQITINTGSLTVSGNVTGTNNKTSGTITFLGAGTLKLGGTMFSASDGTLTTVAGSSVEYNGTAQTIGNFTYRNLILSNSGAKTIANTQTVTVNDTLSMEGTATITTTGTLSYGPSATLQYNTATARTVTLSEWVTPFIATGGVVIKNTGVITLNGNRSFTSAPLTVNAGSTLAMSTFNITSPSELKLQCGGLTSGSSITGSGTLTLGGNITVASAGSGTFGATIAAPLALGASRVFTIANDGTSASDLTVSSVISGTGFQMQKTGAGTLTLSNANTFTGGTTLTAGTININNASALGTTAGTFTISGGSIDNTSGAAITTSAYPMSWGGNFTFVGSNNLTFAAAAVTMTADPVITTTANTLRINGVISGAGRLLTKSGAGTLTLAGANLYTGGTTLTAGTLNINNASALGTVAGTFTINGGSIDNTSGAAITTNAYPMVWAGNFTFVGANDLNLGAGSVTMSSNVQVTTTAKILTVGGIISGSTFDLTKAGGGTLALGANAVTINNLSITSGTFKTTSNTLTIKGAYTNAGTFQDNLGVIQFNGTAAQSIPLAGFNSTINTLKINNAAGVTLGMALVVNNLDLTLGNIDLGTNSLTVNTTITGGSATSYVKTSNIGLLTKNIANTVTQVFPVGNSAYNPVSIKNNSGAADVFTVRVFDQVYTNGFTAPIIGANRVTRTWDINKLTANGGSGIDFVFNWNSGEEDGSFTKKLWHHDGTSWVRQTGTTSVIGTSLTYTGYTGTFSPFAVFDALYLMPVVFTDLKIQKVKSTTLISWNTRQEENSKDFIVQHSTTGSDWTNIGVVLAAGYSSTLKSYSFIHQDPVAGRNFYRIMQRDLDGKSTYTTILFISFDESNDVFSVLSNPVKNGQLKINLPSRTILRLYNSQGQLLKTFNLTGGVQVVDLTGYSTGLYHLEANQLTRTIILQ